MLQVDLPSAFAELFDENLRYVAYYGGRGAGKSHACATAIVTRAAAKPMRVLFLREVQRSLDASVKQLLEDKIAKLGLEDRFRSTFYDIRGSNGSLFRFHGLSGMQPDSLKSMEGFDGAWVEEAHTCSSRSLKILLPTIRKKGSFVWFTWNPERRDAPVEDMFRHVDTPPKRSVVKRVSWRDNPWFTEEMVEEMSRMRVRDYDQYMHVWEGEYMSREDAKVFVNWEILDLDGEVPEDSRPYYGADWGMRDPLALVKVYLIGSDIIYVAREAYSAKSVEIDHIPAFFAGTSFSDRWENPRKYKGIDGGEVLRHRIIGDSNSPAIITYLRRRGFDVRGAKKGKGSVEEGVQFLQSRRLVLHPSCVNTAREVRNYLYKVDPYTDDVLPDLSDNDNHAVDALRYALENERRRAKRLAAVGPM